MLAAKVGRGQYTVRPDGGWVHGWMIVAVLLLPACSPDAPVQGPTTAQLTHVEDLRYAESIEHPLTELYVSGCGDDGDL